mgnify:CR=1 FL=1
MRIRSHQLSVSVGGEMSRVDLPRLQPGEKLLRILSSTSGLSNIEHLQLITPMGISLFSYRYQYCLLHERVFSSFLSSLMLSLGASVGFPPHQVAYLDI